MLELVLDNILNDGICMDLPWSNLFALDLLFCAILPYVWCINPAFFAEYLAPIYYRYFI